MNTTLLIRYDADDHELQRERIADDHFETFNLLQTMLAADGTAKVRVEEIDAHDVCQRCYLVTPVAV